VADSTFSTPRAGSLSHGVRAPTRGALQSVSRGCLRNASGAAWPLTGAARTVTYADSNEGQARSSVVEHYLDTVGVGGSIPPVPTPRGPESAPLPPEALPHRGAFARRRAGRRTWRLACRFLDAVGCAHRRKGGPGTNRGCLHQRHYGFPFNAPGVVVASRGIGINIAGDLSIMCPTPYPGRGILTNMNRGVSNTHKEQEHRKAI
jgi:hypothetical protein